MAQQKLTPEEKERLLRQKQLARAKRLFGEAMRYKDFFADPAVKLAVMVRMYSGAQKSYVLAPGWKVEVEVTRWEDVMEMEEVIRRALKEWAAGRWDRSRGRFRCPECESTNDLY